jgi:hypothetical protein
VRTCYSITCTSEEGVKVSARSKEEYMSIMRDLDIPAYIPTAFTRCGGDIKYEGKIEEKEDFILPTIETMAPFPENSNPFNYDYYNMGCEVSGGWLAMYNEHSGIDFGGKRFPEPKYIILVNSRTGQRFKINFPEGETCGQ